MESESVKSYKVALGAVLAILLVIGLYFINRYWIAPATQKQTLKSQSKDWPMAPAFSLNDLNGRKIDLANQKGKVVLLDFWATWCGPCRIEIPGFVRLQERYRDQGLVVIGVSMDDDVEPVRDFYREFNMNYAVAMGDQRVSDLYGGIIGLPTTFLIGRDGRIYAKHTGATDVSVFEEEIKTLLAANAQGEVAQFQQVGGVRLREQIQLGDPAEIDSEVPGVNLSKLNPQQVAMFKKQLESMKCDCGCNLNFLKCRQNDRACGVSKRVAREQLEKFLKATV
jgi:thiol-disulfide isomerase/thioredoxin